MLIFNTGLSGLRASQAGLQVVSNNIANANTPGYHRQQLQLQDRYPLDINNLQVGTGVDVARIAQVRDGVLEQAITRNLSTQAFTSTELQTLQSIESLFSIGSGTLNDRLSVFFQKAEELSARPQEPVLRTAVLNAAGDLTRELNAVFNGLTRIQSAMEQQARDTVAEVNVLTQQLVSLNNDIRAAEARGLEPNDLRDRRDQIVGQLSGYVDVVTWEWAGQPDVLSFASGAVVVGGAAPTLEVATGPDGQLQVRIAGTETPLRIADGQLGGLLAGHNEIVAEFAGRLNDFTAALIQSIDSVQATGLGIEGAFTHLESTRAVSDVALPLAQSDPAFPILNGQLTVAVRDETTGERRLFQIDVDPAVDSLQDIATRIAAIDHLQAFVSPATGTLTIASDSGYAFDFTRDLASLPDAAGIIGSSRPSAAGAYDGAVNDIYTITATTAGSVGSTPGLLLEVRNAAGNLVSTLDVGQGYEAGTPLDLGHGVSLRLSSGTINVGDTFDIPLIADSDTSDLLPALGIRTFFSGTTAADIAVNASLMSNPDRLAISLTGLAGDSAHIEQLLAVRNAFLVGDPPTTLESHLAETTALVGTRIQSTRASADNLSRLGTQLNNDRESISGVDPNEEFVRLMQFQRSFQASARLISAWDESLDDLFLLIR